MTRFRMIRASVEQFALLADRITDINSVVLNISTESAYSPGNKTIAIRMKFDASENKTPDFVLELICVFQLEDDLEFRQGDDLCIPKEFIAHLAMHTVGTARGILICKMEGTAFAPYILPAIDVTKMITEDFKSKGLFRQEK